MKKVYNNQIIILLYFLSLFHSFLHKIIHILQHDKRDIIFLLLVSHLSFYILLLLLHSCFIHITRHKNGLLAFHLLKSPLAALYFYILSGKFFLRLYDKMFFSTHNRHCHNQKDVKHFLVWWKSFGSSWTSN